MRCRLARAGAAALLTLLSALALAASAGAAGGDPLFVFTPKPPPPPALPKPPPNGYFNAPCGLAVDSIGRIYVSDYHHDTVDVFTAGSSQASLPGYVTQLATVDTLDGPCDLALDAANHLYVNDYHRRVLRYGASPSFGSPTTIAGEGADSTHPTGVAVDGASGRVYVDARTHVAVYDSSGAPLEEGGEPVRIGVGTLEDGYGLALSGYSGTAGRLYVPDAATDTVKVYDPAGADKADPVASIGGPPGGFVSLRDSAVAVDDATGVVYVIDNTQPADAEQPRAMVDVFGAGGTYLGHLRYEVVEGAPSGLAVDNSGGVNQGHVYVTSGNTHEGGLYAYAAGAATPSALAPTIPGLPLGGSTLKAQIPIGGPVPGGLGTQIACTGDACQILPPEPADPTLTTLLSGPGNPKVRYSHKAPRRCPKAAKRCRHAKRGAGGARASAATATPQAAGPAAAHGSAGAPASSSTPAPPSASGLLAGSAGFDAEVRTDGAAATPAGSHPYRLGFTLGLDQSGGEEDLREARFTLPPGMLADPAAAGLCTAGQFAAPRSSPFESSLSGESCSERSQVGTIEVRSGLGPLRRFGLFNLNPAPGTAAQLGASPYGIPLVLDARIDADATGAHLTLEAKDIPQSLQLHGIRLALWGAPMDASHNGERGNCLDESEPAFPWARCSIGEPLASPPLAFLTLPTTCSPTLAFGAEASSWQRPTPVTAQALNRDAGDAPVAVTDCASLRFEPHVEAFLSTRRASSASGFVFRLSDEDPGLADPRARVHSLARGAVVQLPDGVTLNPSLGAGLGVCTPAQYAAESAVNPQGGGCPNGSKIGDFIVHSPFYEGFLEGAVYLAAPHENPFGSLLAIYLVAKAADRDIVVKAAGRLDPDPGDGTLTASFEDLPQLPYTDLEVNIRSGQRAPLISPDACGAARTQISITPWAQGAPGAAGASDSPIETGIDGGPCPSGTPPFAPGAIAGGVNSNVNSYTPYFVHLVRKDTEQEITSYSLTLPKGITGKLAGIPFCPDAAIAAARGSGGFAEAASPSCPASSQVGRTLTGYGIGSTLSYAAGAIYLAGPYHGAPLSLVTVNPATVGPFDLGTVVVRSAFDVDPLSAQLQIDSRASDRIPHILDGVPLHLRDVRIYMDRREFTHNPSSCEASVLVSTLTGAGARLGDPSDDSSATVQKHFQLLNCLTLGFEPKLGLRLRGSARRGAFPALRASFAARGPQDSNLKRIEVDMPHQLFLAQNHIRSVCTRVQFAAERCPASSVYGTAVADTPLLDQPLRGNVYLRSSDNKLPDLVTSLRSGSIRIDLVGRIGPSKQGGIQAFFDELPDAPIERFTMLLAGGRHGLLTNSVNICAAPPLATVKALGQNNKGRVFSTKLRGQCDEQGHRPSRQGAR